LQLILHSELRRRAASRRALPCPSSFWCNTVCCRPLRVSSVIAVMSIYLANKDVRTFCIKRIYYLHQSTYTQIIHIDFATFSLSCSAISICPNVLVNDIWLHENVALSELQLEQSWWRRIQALGLSEDYEVKGTPVAQWLLVFWGLPLLPADEVVAAFTDEIMSRMPNDDRCRS